MVVAAFLVLFACIGIAHVVNPDWFIERSGAGKGREMLTEWNRFGFRYSGAFFGRRRNVHALFALAELPGKVTSYRLISFLLLSNSGGKANFVTRNTNCIRENYEVRSRQALVSEFATGAS